MRDTVTVPEVRGRKRAQGAQPIVMITAYDTPSAKIVDESLADIILVGDSLGMVVLGYDNTLAVTMEDMIHHVSAVKRSDPKALLVADMPWMSYHVSVRESVLNAASLIRAGANAVKLEGGQNRLDVIHAINDAEIPVMGHLGLTPQSVNAFGGFKVQAREEATRKRLLEDALAICEAGVFAVVLEGIPSEAAKEVTEAIGVPTIGIGAGPNCDGQVLVFHDLLGYSLGRKPKFVRSYETFAESGIAALALFREDVIEGRYPKEAESYK